MKINYINNNIMFRGVSRQFECHSQNNVLPMCVNETHFMRDLDSSMFVANYIKNNFPAGTNIADWGCSSGYETYTLATLLNDANKNKKYKIKGYDLIQENIDSAKKAEFYIGSKHDAIENFLLDDKNPLTSNQKAAKKAFETCFEKVNDFNTYKPKTDLFKDIVDFERADIFDIDKKSSKNGVVLFKNALYHLYDTQFKNGCAELKNITKIENLFKKINKTLDKNGIFVMGSLNADHLHTDKNYLSPMQKYQNGKLINILDSTPIHKILRICGFEPVFYDIYKNVDGEICGKNFLPAVWKKVKNV